ncbi:M3 family metallopeptidase [Pseudohoeflea coraliihabitans]|uniref:M3 family metallopeptidase n=1 Tax=Pseudohoeflea coraliihabitans TaxID=2860393 RepID=A0ABS6WNU7_9HYPH|nr:M3 family metallopeptidase [Pseudohoeflea sp. DP4N28-3]MBW3096749.1 M3 family metallopeptidase [Pseudohoeflea sp. DP4N28-3]
MTTSEAAAGTDPIFAWTAPLGLPDFAAIADADFAPAFSTALKAHEVEIAAIAENPAAADFDNTIVALERAGEKLGRVSALFWNRAGTDTSAEIQSLERDIAPRLSRHYSKIAMNAALFSRVDRLYDQRASLQLTGEQQRLLERIWKSFVKAGARLDADGQARLAAIGERLAGLGAQFGQNVLADESDWMLLLGDGPDLDGLPDHLVEAMAAIASERGHPGQYAVTLSRSIIEPFLAASDRRDLRETAFKAWIARGDGGNTTDNWALIGEIVALRAEKAKLLGYGSYADLKLDDTMAKSPDAVEELLGDVWQRAVARARQEESELAELVAEAGLNHPVAAWDWRYFADKLKARKFDFSESELKPYLSLERMIEAAFDVANRLFGISMTERPDIAGPHPDARVFEVRGDDGTIIAIFIADYFARPSKRSGAWMSALQPQHKLPGPDGGVGQKPIIINVMNFSKPAVGRPALLSFDDARTLFHEFGHAVHGMLSNVIYPSLSGTAVSRDFVELPSQLYEHWLSHPEVLSRHARHYETGAPMPQELLEKVLAARTFNSGFATTEFTASALIDMAWHSGPAAIDDPASFEADNLRALGLPEAIVMRHRSPHFLHVFSGDGYAAGYYSYMWSEVLDADAFAAFEEAGDPFDKATADKLKEHVYAAGGSRDPAELYTAFRGRLPTPEAMLVKKGLAA